MWQSLCHRRRDAESVLSDAHEPVQQEYDVEGKACVRLQKCLERKHELNNAGGPRWEPTSPRSSMSTTQKIRAIGREARVNQLISERLDYWKAAMRERGAQPSACIPESV